MKARRQYTIHGGNKIRKVTSKFGGWRVGDRRINPRMERRRNKLKKLNAGAARRAEEWERI